VYSFSQWIRAQRDTRKAENINKTERKTSLFWALDEFPVENEVAFPRALWSRTRSMITKAIKWNAIRLAVYATGASAWLDAHCGDVDLPKLRVIFRGCDARRVHACGLRRNCPRSVFRDGAPHFEAICVAHARRARLRANERARERWNNMRLHDAKLSFRARAQKQMTRYYGIVITPLWISLSSKYGYRSCP
jgi:hypothetical protein